MRDNYVNILCEVPLGQGILCMQAVGGSLCENVTLWRSVVSVALE